MSGEAVQADAQALIAMSVADIVAHLDGVDLETLQAALAAEQAKGDAARKGAIAALTAAVDGHPEQAAEAAAAAETDTAEQAKGDGGDIEQPLADPPPSPDALSAAPPRPHAGLVSQFELRWAELKNFIVALEGEIDGELGEVLAFVRSKL